MYSHNDHSHVKPTKCGSSKNVWQSIVQSSTTLSLIKGTSVKQHIYCLTELIDFNVFLITINLVTDWIVIVYNALLNPASQKCADPLLCSLMPFWTHPSSLFAAAVALWDSIVSIGCTLWNFEKCCMSSRSCFLLSHSFRHTAHVTLYLVGLWTKNWYTLS